MGKLQNDDVYFNALEEFHDACISFEKACKKLMKDSRELYSAYKRCEEELKEKREAFFKLLDEKEVEQ